MEGTGWVASAASRPPREHVEPAYAQPHLLCFIIRRWRSADSRKMPFDQITAVADDPFYVVEVEQTAHEESPILALGLLPAVEVTFAELLDIDVLEIQPSVVGMPIILLVDVAAQRSDQLYNVLPKLGLVLRCR